MSPQLQTSLLIAACCGALIGLLRQWSEAREGQADQELAGLRSHALWAIIGCLAAYAGLNYNQMIFVSVFAIFGLYTAGTILLHHAHGDERTHDSTFGITIITFFVGSLIAWGEQQVAVMLSVAAATLVVIRRPIHQWSQQLTPDDIRITLQFLAITGIILPLVPDHGYGPYASVNPYSIWFMVVLISGIGFVGYAAMRAFGASFGVMLTGLIGGLASSTATTLALSKQSAHDSTRSRSYLLGVLMASSVMLIRVGLLAFIISPQTGRLLVLPLIIMGGPSLLIALWIAHAHESTPKVVRTEEISNPLNLGTALKFALVYGLVRLLVEVLGHMQSNAGIIALSFLSGLTDMDAITLSTSQAAAADLLAVTVAAQATIVAAVANTIFKFAITLPVASESFRKQFLLASVGTALAGLAALNLIK